MTTASRVRIFSNGTQYMDWSERNCLRCTKGPILAAEESQDDDIPSDCPLCQALSSAFWDDGTVSAEEAEQLGYQAGYYTWRCPARTGK